MAMALALSAPTGSSTVRQHAVLWEEWCEWERTQLRAASSSVALESLNTRLHEHASVSVVPHSNSLTVADIVILSTLYTTTALSSVDGNKYPAIQRYMSIYEASYQQALDTIQTFLQSSVTDQAIEFDLQESSLQKALFDYFQKIIESSILPSNADISLPLNMVTKCSKPKDGDFQCSAAMPVFSFLKKQNMLGDAKSPQQLAQQIIQTIEKQQNPPIEEIQVVGPGFLAFRVGTKVLEQLTNAIVESGRMPVPKVPVHTCLVDFSSPNIAKEMHVGHLRSTIIGEAVCRILEFVGNKVHRVNHVGDWGTQFGMLIQYLKEEYPDVASNANTELPNITDLTEFYKNAKKRFDESPEFKKTSQLNVVDLQSGNEECLRIWKMLCDVSRREFDKVYKRLDVTTHEFGESFYNEKIPAAIDDFQRAGLLTVEEGGAKCVFLKDKKFKIPLMLQKSDGGYGYDSTDIAALKYRLFEVNADRVVYITDYSQADHFKMVFAAGHDIGWVKEQNLQHIGFGTVNGEDGKRFKTRSGETVRLVDLLDEAVNRMDASLKARIEEGRSTLTLEDVHEVAEAMGYGAVKYYDLRRNPTSDYKFSYDEMLDTKGDTAIYLLYARVRLESICAKAQVEYNVDMTELLKTQRISLEHPSEKNLAFHVNQFSDMIELTLGDLFPYHVCEYVYRLANAASDFVTQCKVLGSPEMNSRLLLCHVTTIAMKQCFDLLGIRHVKRI